MEPDFPASPPPPPPAVNPYAPPLATVSAPLYESGPQAPLASAGSRLGAQLLNGVVMIPTSISCGIAIATIDGETQSMNASGIALMVVGLLYALFILVVNLRLMAREGQSLGKKWAKVRVVRTDGSRASLGRLLGLRYLVNGLLSGIPLLGPFYALTDILFIFREDRRCIHDLMADTKVVVA